MPAGRTIGILLLALAAGCTGLSEAPPGVMAQSASMIVEPAPVEARMDVPVAAEPDRSELKKEAIVASAPPAAPAMSQSAAKAVPPPAKAPAKVSAPALATEQPRKSENPAPAAKELEPTLDLAALQVRLRDTKAIGVLSKLALKNQVDDLVKQFRAHYRGGQKTSVSLLRQPYNMLVLKVLSLVQDSDPSLARTISGSREAIWGILADPEKFNSAVA